MLPIIDERFNDIFCSSDTVCLDIGDNYADEDGDPMPKYSFNAGGDWDFVREGETLLSGKTLFAVHGRDGRAASLDPAVRALIADLTGQRVAEADFDPQTGNLTVLFTGGIRFRFFGTKGGFIGLYPHHGHEPILSYGEGVHYIYHDED